MRLYDVIVVGMGPGGSMAAIGLASRGMRVLGIEKESFPRYKACGGCISAKINQIGDININDISEDKIYGARFTFRYGSPFEVLSDSVIGYNVKRDRFDALLLDKAISAGARVLEGQRVKGMEESTSHVSVRTDSGNRYNARYLVVADGAAGVLSREYFGRKSKGCAVSLVSEISRKKEVWEGLDGRLYIDFGSLPQGYAWIFPKGDSLSIGLATDAMDAKGRIKSYFKEFISSHDILKQFDIERVYGWTIPLYDGQKKQLVKGRSLAVGDAGFLVDPFLGEGIYYAIKSGIIAAEVISSKAKYNSTDLASYQERVESEFYPEFDAAMKLSRLVYRHPRLWYGIVQGDKCIIERYFDVIRGDEDYQSFYQWVIKRLKSKPWSFAKRWFEESFLLCSLKRYGHYLKR